MMTIIRQLGGY